MIMGMCWCTGCGLIDWSIGPSTGHTSKRSHKDCAARNCIKQLLMGQDRAGCGLRLRVWINTMIAWIDSCCLECLWVRPCV